MFALFSAVCVVVMLKHISKDNLLVCYLALVSALGCLFVILRAYFTSISNNQSSTQKALTKNPPQANAIAFIMIISALHTVFFHFPLLAFIRANLALTSFSSVLLFVSLILFAFALTAFMPLLLALISVKLSKIWFALISLTNALAVYFVATYGVFLDKTMMGNLFNTNPTEAGEFLSVKMALWIVALGIIPAYFILSQKSQSPHAKHLQNSAERHF